MAKLRHLAIVVNDLEASACFYEKIFDMTRAYESAGRAIYLTDGVMNLALLEQREYAVGRCRRHPRTRNEPLRLLRR